LLIRGTAAIIGDDGGEGEDGGGGGSDLGSLGNETVVKLNGDGFADKGFPDDVLFGTIAVV
jgi:hypothetical protein